MGPTGAVAQIGIAGRPALQRLLEFSKRSISQKACRARAISGSRDGSAERSAMNSSAACRRLDRRARVRPIPIAAPSAAAPTRTNIRLRRRRERLSRVTPLRKASHRSLRERRAFRMRITLLEVTRQTAGLPEANADRLFRDTGAPVVSRLPAPRMPTVATRSKPPRDKQKRRPAEAKRRSVVPPTPTKKVEGPQMGCSARRARRLKRGVANATSQRKPPEPNAAMRPFQAPRLSSRFFGPAGTPQPH